MIAWMFWPVLITATFYAALAFLWCSAVVFMLAAMLFTTINSWRQPSKDRK